MTNSQNERIIKKDISSLSRKSYLNYSMAVIVSRALPDARDGLKPVHRRILQAFADLNVVSTGEKKKSARIVGHAMGQYHPHGDSSIYEAMVRMTQDFSYRYPIIEGQGNFGSIDGDGAAAMRYTEARMSPFAELLLKEMNKDTIDFTPNYDGSVQEAVVLPSRFPNLLVNGTSGIAVGMSSSMPSHNLNEVIDGIFAYMKNENITLKQMMKFIKGPDFPTGACIIGTDEIIKAYETGEGKLVVRGVATVEEAKNKRQNIIISEIPFGVTKPNLIEKIAKAVRSEQILDVQDVRDESDKSGVRIVIELKKGAEVNKVMDGLLKKTPFESSFRVNNLAIVKGVPKTLGLIDLIKIYVEHQREVIQRRTEFDLAYAKKQAHILEALVIVGNNVDKVVKVIRGSKNPEEARTGLMTKFKLTEVQARAVLDLRLHRITTLEVRNTEEELQRYMEEIERLEGILSDSSVLDAVIVSELRDIKKKFSDERRTKIYASSEVHEEEVEQSSEINKKTFAVSISNKGYLFVADQAMVERQSSSFFNLKGDDFFTHQLKLTSDSTLLLINQNGNLFKINASDLPENNKKNDGTLLSSISNLGSNDTILAAFNSEVEEGVNSVYFITKQGMIKRLSLEDMITVRNGSSLTKLKDGDELLTISLGKEEDELLLFTRKGFLLKTNTKTVRPMGRTAAGVALIGLAEDDLLLTADVLGEDTGTHFLAITSNGFGKLIAIDSLKEQNRATKGSKFATLRKADGEFIQTTLTDAKGKLIALDSKGKGHRFLVKNVNVLELKDKVEPLIELQDTTLTSLLKEI